MKSLSTTLLAVSVLPLGGMAADFSTALERMSANSPEFVFYADVEGDFASAGSFLTEAYLAYLATGPEIPPVPVDVTKVFRNFGFTNMTDVTIASSPREVNGFINQMMIRFEGNPGGLFKLSGTANQPFEILQQAPSDAEFVTEFRLSGDQLFSIIKTLVIDVMGPMGQGIIDGQMNQPVIPEGPTLAQIVEGLNTTIQIAVKPDSSGEASSMPPGMSFLAGDFVVRIEGLASMLQPFTPMLAGAGFSEISADGGRTWKLSLPEEQFPLPVFLHTVDESGDVLVTLRETSKTWFMNGSSDSLATSEAFNKAVEGLPMTGLSFWYSSERMSRMQIENLDAQMAMPELAPVMAVLENYLMRFTGPQAGVSYLEADAYRVVNFQPASYKTNLALAATLVPVGIFSGIQAQQAAMEAEASETEGEETEPSPAD